MLVSEIFRHERPHLESLPHESGKRLLRVALLGPRPRHFFLMFPDPLFEPPCLRQRRC